MITAAKSILLAIAAACGGVTGAASNPDEPPEVRPPPEEPLEKDHYFCCSKLADKGFSGDGCVEIPESHVIACTKVLYCDGKYKKDEQKVTCESKDP